MDVRINDKYQNIDGFTAQEGFLLFYDQDELKGISSGWNSNDALMVYTKSGDKWEGDWYFDNEEIFPVYDAMDMKEAWEHEQDFKEAVEEAREQEDLYVGDSFDITDTFPGEKSSNGGEYGFYSHYTKTDVPGVYELETSTTCDFDNCGTGYEGFFALTNEEVENMLKEEEIRRENYYEHGYGYISETDLEYSHNFETMVEEAGKKEDLYTGDNFGVVIGLSRGEVSANYVKTDVPGVYEYERSNDLSRNGLKNYTVLTNERVKEILEKERKLKERYENRDKSNKRSGR